MRTSLSIILLATACSEYDLKGKTEAPGTETAEPQIEVDPQLVDFGTRRLTPGLSDAEVVKVRNIGAAELLVESVALLDATGPFSVTTLSGVTLQPEEETSFVVTWSPTALGTDIGQAHVQSLDPDRPVVAVELTGEVTEDNDTGEPDTTAPDIVLNPTHHDFGMLDAGTSDTMTLEIHNAGDADLVVDSITFAPSSSDLSFNPNHSINGSFPWVIAPGATLQTHVDYAPTDDTGDNATVTVVSDDPDESEAIASQTGNARPFEGFSTGWYIHDDGLAYETTSSGSHPVDHHGDHDLYWYEISGAHGLVDSSDPETDFEILRDFVITMAGSPSVVSGPLSFSSGSSLATFEFATFTYILCDFWIEPGEDPARYEVSAGSVDDGIQVMVNAEILGHMGLGESPTSWSLASVGRPGEVNTLVVILVDDSRVDRYLRDLAFYKDGVMVE